VFLSFQQSFFRTMLRFNVNIFNFFPFYIIRSLYGIF
jgi:hypothetical protein